MNDPRKSALILAEEILTNIEMADIGLSAVMLKCARLARLIGDEDHRKAFAFEAGGYPNTPTGVPNEAFELGRRAGRIYKEKDNEGKLSEKMNTSSVEMLESLAQTDRIALAAAIDPDVSISSSNPAQHVFAPTGNSQERQRLRISINNSVKIIATSKAFAYTYATNVYFELQFSGAASDIFERSAERIDIALLGTAPQAAQKTASIRTNLASENPEDWANAVHSCRRLLQDVADVLFPPQEDRKKDGKSVKLGHDNYINRLICFIEDNSASERFQEIVGSSLSYIGERLDAVFRAAQKGSHSVISSRDEAERYVIYTYLTVGDILALKPT